MTRDQWFVYWGVVSCMLSFAAGLWLGRWRYRRQLKQLGKLTEEDIKAEPWLLMAMRSEAKVDRLERQARSYRMKAEEERDE